MILNLAEKWSINLENSFIIGDNWKDIESGKSAGCRTILLDKFYNKSVQADYRTKNLAMSAEVVKSYVTKQQRQRRIK
jgi:D-glycero-D-manno-heptose 1,7-bisphosphate phosphatase